MKKERNYKKNLLLQLPKDYLMKILNNFKVVLIYLKKT